MRTGSWTPKRPTSRPHPHPGICHDYGLGPSLIPYEALNIDLNIIGFIYVYTLITYYRWYMQPLSTKTALIIATACTLLLLAWNVSSELLYTDKHAGEYQTLMYIMDREWSLPILGLSLGMFIIFSRMQFRSRIINTIASWTLGVYLITDRNYIRDLLWTQWFAFDKLKWPDFCSALTVRRLVPLDVDNTRFPPLRVSCSPGTGAGASSPRHETHRNVANSRSFRSAKGLRRHTSSVLYAPSALSAMALSYESPTVPVDGSIPYSITPVAYTMPVHCVPWSLLNRCRFNSD